METGMKTNLKSGVPFLSFEILDRTGLVSHGFSLRDGGVSRGPYGSMNLSFTMGDEEKNVRGNFGRMGEALGVSPMSMTSVWQAHTDRIKVVGPADGGQGIVMTKERIEWDGMVTATPGITMVTLHADCLPLFFLDPVNRAAGLVHSGWRGTRKGIGLRALEAMGREFGTKPGDVLAAIGPGICGSCFEVGPEVAAEFLELPVMKKAPALVAQSGGGKYHLDLAGVNRMLLLEGGVREDHLAMAGLCTRCRPDLFFSHRRDGEIRGSMAAFMALR